MPRLIARKQDIVCTFSFQLNLSNDDPLTFDTHSFACITDNSANTHIWNNANGIIPSTLRDYTHTREVTTIGSDSLRKGIGNKHVHWQDTFINSHRCSFLSQLTCKNY